MTVLLTAGHAPYFAASSEQFIATVVEAEKQVPLEYRLDAHKYILRRRKVSASYRRTSECVSECKVDLQ